MLNLDKLIIKLQTIPNIGSAKIKKLLSIISAEEFSHYKRSELLNLGWNEQQIEAWLKFDHKIIDLHEKWLEQPDQYMISIFSSEYPFLLSQIANPPIFLLAKGNHKLLSKNQIAIVGSRNYSNYGENCTKFFTNHLVEADLVINSGLAIGIDSIAHQQTIKSNGYTIAVLGSAINKIYPSQHQYLAKQIIDHNGLIISEFILDTKAIAINFPRRNRVISGLSLGTLVIEAGLKSGSLITAKYALEQNREVFAVPGIIFNDNNQGCHYLIKQGAILVDSVEDILQALNFQSSSLKNITNLLINKPKIDPIYPELYKKIQYQPILLDDLVLALNKPAEIIIGQLLELELQGLIENKNGYYIRCY